MRVLFQRHNNATGYPQQPRNPGGTLPENCPDSPRSVFGQRPHSFQLLGRTCSVFWVVSAKMLSKDQGRLNVDQNLIVWFVFVPVCQAFRCQTSLANCKFARCILPSSPWSPRVPHISSVGGLRNRCFGVVLKVVLRSLSWLAMLGPPVVLFYPFWGEGSPTKTDYRKKGTLILSSLLEDLECMFCLFHSIFTPRTALALAPPFFPGILLSRKPPDTRGKRIRFLKSKMVEKNGTGINR